MGFRGGGGRFGGCGRFGVWGDRVGDRVEWGIGWSGGSGGVGDRVGYGGIGVEDGLV